LYIRNKQRGAVERLASDPVSGQMPMNPRYKRGRSALRPYHPLSNGELLQSAAHPGSGFWPKAGALGGPKRNRNPDEDAFGRVMQPARQTCSTKSLRAAFQLHANREKIFTFVRDSKVMKSAGPLFLSSLGRTNERTRKMCVVRHEKRLLSKIEKENNL